MFKPAPGKVPHAPLRELSCPRCGIILVIELPKGEAAYPCVCGYSLDLVVTQAA